MDYYFNELINLQNQRLKKRREAVRLPFKINVEMQNNTAKIQQSNLKRKEEIQKNFAPHSIVISDATVKNLFKNVCLIRQSSTSLYYQPFISSTIIFSNGLRHIIRMTGSLNPLKPAQETSINSIDFQAQVIDSHSEYNDMEVNITESIINAQTLAEGIRRLKTLSLLKDEFNV